MLVGDFQHASIMDIKIGKITYDIDATNEKIQKEVTKTNKSTGLTLNFRITGYILKDEYGNISEKRYRKNCFYNLKSQDILPLLNRFLRSNNGPFNKKALMYFV